MNETNSMGYMMGTNSGSWTPKGIPMMHAGFGYVWGVNSLLVTALLVVLIRYFWQKTK